MPVGCWLDSADGRFQKGQSIPLPPLMVHPIGSNNWRLIHVGNVELSFRGAFSGRVDSEACGGNARLLLPSAIQPSPQTCKLRPARQRSLQKGHTQPPLQTAHWPSIIIKCLLIQWLSKMFPNSESIRTGISFFFFFFLNTLIYQSFNALVMARHCCDT